MPKNKRQFDSSEDVLALDPRAVSAFFFDWEPSTPSYSLVGRTAVIGIDGPLSQRASWWLGYDSIEQTFADALANHAVDSVVLSLDSPGGSVAGLFECVRRMREAAQTAGKPVVAYIDEQACSAAYALACVADEIVTPETGMLGSIGVIATARSYAEANRAEGMQVVVVTSGKQKADLHSDLPITEEAIGRLKDRVNMLASLFFERVTERRNISVESVRALEAGVLYGQQAVDAGLADRVGGYSAALSAASKRAEKRRMEMSMKLLAQILGLADNATESEIATVLQRQREHAHRLCAVTGKTDLAEAVATAAAWKGAAEQTEALAREVGELRGRLETGERTGLIEAARRAGKVTPAMSENAEWNALIAGFSVPQLKVYLSTLPASVSTKVHEQPSLNGSVTGPVATLTHEEKLIAKQMGLSESAVLANKQRLAAERSGTAV